MKTRVRLSISNKHGALKSCMAVIIALVAVLVIPQVAFADVSANNTSMGKPLAYGFRYQKTIDMTNAPNKKAIPDVSFNYTLKSVAQDAKNLGLGATYRNGSGEGFVIKPGTLPANAQSMHASTVTFRSIDHYWPELENLVDNNKVDDTINFIVNYCWGEMRSSDHGQTTIIRLPLPGELEEARQYENARTWPDMMSPWKASQEWGRENLTPEGYYRAETDCGYESGSQSLLEYKHPMDYVTTFSLHTNHAVTYSPYAIRAPFVSRLNRNAQDEITSVSKPLFSPEELEDLMDKLQVEAQKAPVADNQAGQQDEHASQTEQQSSDVSRAAQQSVDATQTEQQSSDVSRAAQQSVDATQTEQQSNETTTKDAVTDQAVQQTDNVSQANRQNDDPQQQPLKSIYRYILTEDNAPEGFETNGQQLILDFSGDYTCLALFNSVDEADAYYHQLIADGTIQQDWWQTFGIYKNAPAATFINTYKPQEPEPEPGHTTEQPQSKLPPTGDAGTTGALLMAAGIALTLAVYVTRQRNLKQ